MATRVAQTQVTIDKSGSQILHSNPAVHPLPLSAGVPVTAAAKTPGNPNGKVNGQVSGTTVVVNNPA